MYSKIIALITIFSIFNGAIAEYSYMDSIRIGHNIGIDLKKQYKVLNDVVKIRCLAGLLINLDQAKKSKDMPISREKVMRSFEINHLLNTCKQMDRALLVGGGVLLVVDSIQAGSLALNAPLHFRSNNSPIIPDSCSTHTRYLAWYEHDDASVVIASYKVAPAVDLAIDQLGQTEYFQNLGENFAPETRQFIDKNVKIVTHAGLMRSGKIIYQEGMQGLTLAQGKSFCKDVTRQVSCCATEQLVLNPLINKTMGKEASLSKDMVSLAVNYAAYSFINSMVNKI